MILSTSGTFTIPTSDTEISKANWALNDLYATSGFTVVQNKSIDVNNTETNISTNDPMLLIPLELKKWDTTHKIAQANTNKECYLEITCKIIQNDVHVFGSATEYKTLYVPFGATWQPGKRYIYTLIFGGGYDADGNPILQPINFEAAVDDWKEEPKSNVNL